MEKIESFTGDYRFLSNFYFPEFRRIPYEGINYPTVEHAYQAAKTLDNNQRIKIAQLDTPGKAKRAGRQVKLREDWDEVKLQVMTNLIWMKFQVPGLRLKLLATGDVELIEGNYWGDTYWGVCRGKGENNLGKILMNVRKVLQ